MPKSTLEASEAELRSAQGLVATYEGSDRDGELWQVGVYAEAFDEPITADLLQFVVPVGADVLATRVSGLLDRVGLRLELPWRVVHDGYFMTGVWPDPT